MAGLVWSFIWSFCPMLWDDFCTTVMLFWLPWLFIYLYIFVFIYICKYIYMYILKSVMMKSSFSEGQRWNFDWDFIEPLDCLRIRWPLSQCESSDAQEWEIFPSLRWSVLGPTGCYVREAECSWYRYVGTEGVTWPGGSPTSQLTCYSASASPDLVGLTCALKALLGQCVSTCFIVGSCFLRQGNLGWP